MRWVGGRGALLAPPSDFADFGNDDVLGFGFGKHVGRATYKPPYPNNEDLQVWKGVLNTSDLDDVLLIRNVKIDAEGKLDEASLRLAAQLPIPLRDICVF